MCIEVPGGVLRSNLKLFNGSRRIQYFAHNAYARPAYTWLSHSPLHDRKTLANARNGRSYYVNASHRRGDRGRAPTAAMAHHDRLWGRSRRLLISTARGASVEPQGAELQPRGPPPAASARPTAAAPETRAAEAREDSRRRPSGTGSHLGAIPAATHVSVLRCIRSAA